VLFVRLPSHSRLLEILIDLCLADPGVHMYNQAKYGDIDVITGDYLAGV
jgi:hypothetical protein